MKTKLVTVGADAMIMSAPEMTGSVFYAEIQGLK